MPLIDVIDDYSNGATGTLTDTAGDQVGYTVTGTSPTVNFGGFNGGARVNANGTQAFTVTYDEPVVGAALRIAGSDNNEKYFVVVDGVTVDLNVLIANGDVVFTKSGAQNHKIEPNGSISGGRFNDGSVAELVFTKSVTSIGAFGSGAGGGNWDYFDVGIDSATFNVVCLTRGTRVETATGLRAIETLSVGDLVRTLGHGRKTVRWIGSRAFGASVLAEHENLRPVRITAGALGKGLPKRDLLVSRQHRMLVSSKVAQRLFGSSDVLIPAIKLTALPGIFVDMDVQQVEYFHVLFDRHEVIFAEGAPTESLFTGHQALRTIPAAARAEIFTILPELADTAYCAEPAGLIPSGKLQKQLVARHAKNDKPLLELFAA